MTDFLDQFTMTCYTALTVPSPGNGTASYYRFQFVHNGWIPSVQDVGDTVHRLGGAGTVLQSIGTIAGKVTFPMESLFATKADLLNFCGSIEALSDAVVQVSDAWGRSLPRVRITEPSARPTRKTGGTISGGLPVLYMAACQLSFERMPDS